MATVREGRGGPLRVSMHAVPGGPFRLPGCRLFSSDGAVGAAGGQSRAAAEARLAAAVAAADAERAAIGLMPRVAEAESREKCSVVLTMVAKMVMAAERGSAKERADVAEEWRNGNAKRRALHAIFEQAMCGGAKARAG